MAWQMALAIPLAALGTWFFVRMARELKPAAVRPFGVGDAFFASLISLWFLSAVAASSGSPQQVSIPAIWGSMILYSGLVGMVLLFVTVRRISWDEAFGLSVRDFPGLARTALLSFASALPVVFLAQALGNLLSGPEENPAQPLLEFWMGGSGWEGKALVAGMAVIVAPICEEFLFRGYLYGTAKRYVGMPGALLATSALFAAVHMHLPAFGGLFFLSVGFTLLYESSQTIWAPVIMHSAFNLFSLVASLLWPELA